MKDIFKKIIVTILIFEVKLILKKNKPKIIAITGNLGKTTTKDFIFEALKDNLIDQNKNSLVLASKKSMNSEFGVPLTILELNTGWNNIFSWFEILIKGFIKIFDKFPYKYLVLEIGADAPNDIKNICKYIKPDIAVLTAFAETPVHIEFFHNNRDLLIREKKYLIENIKEGGLFIYNKDDKDCENIKKEFENKNIKIKSFSIKDNNADIFISDIEVNIEEINNHLQKINGTTAYINFKDGNIKKKIILNDVLGEAIFYSLLPSILIAEELNIDINKAIFDIEGAERTKGRMRILNGIFNSNIIDDTYNSSPKALQNGINLIKNIKMKSKKIFVIGDMLELGDYTKREHEKAGKDIATVTDILITSGIRSKILGESAINGGINKENVFIMENSIKAGEKLLEILEKLKEEDYKSGKTQNQIGGYLIFIKGSQGARMEKALSKIVDKNKHNLEEVLVRQEKDWKLR